MMRLPRFRYRAPRTVAEAAAILAGGSKGVMEMIQALKKARQQVETVSVPQK